jgi:hypothetical protein
MTSDSEFLDSLSDEGRKSLVSKSGTIPMMNSEQEEMENFRKRLVTYIAQKKQKGWTMRRIRRELKAKHNINI